MYTLALCIHIEIMNNLIVFLYSKERMDLYNGN